MDQLLQISEILCSEVWSLQFYKDIGYEKDIGENFPFGKICWSYIWRTMNGQLNILKAIWSLMCWNSYLMK